MEISPWLVPLHTAVSTTGEHPEVLLRRKRTRKGPRAGGEGIYTPVCKCI